MQTFVPDGSLNLLIYVWAPDSIEPEALVQRSKAPFSLSSAAQICACLTQQRAPLRSSGAPNCSCVLTSWFRRITDFPPLRDGALRDCGTSVGVGGSGVGAAPELRPSAQQIATSSDTGLLNTSWPPIHLHY